MVKSITTVSSPFPDGQRVTGLVLEYDREFESCELDGGSFEVKERTVTGARTDGSCIIIDLNPKDAKSSTLFEKGRHISEPRPKMGPGGPGGHEGPGGPGGPGGHGGPPEIVLPDGRKFKGPHGIAASRPAVEVEVLQKAEIQGEPAWEESRVNDRECNELADLFEVKTLEDMEYNLYVPEDYDPDKKYPLVLFIHDAGATGDSPRVTLEQGLGALAWVTKEIQNKHHCFVVAPQHHKEFPIANDNYWCFDDEHTIKKIVDRVCEEYSIDTARLYTTGQSMGFMTSVQLMLDYPGFFAAALLPAGHWDIEKTATLWDKKIWMFLSEDDKGGMNLIQNLPGAIEKIGGRLGIYSWDANQPTEEIGRLIESVKDDGYSFRMTVFPTGSIMRPDQPDRTDGGGHAGTWHFVYQIKAALEWLLEQ